TETNKQISGSTIERALAAAALFVFSAGCFFVALFNPVTTHIMPACPMLSITGFACPGCGLTRGFHALFHGDIITALDFNAIIPMYVIGFVYGFLALFLFAVRGKGLPYKRVGPIGLGVFLLVSIIFGVLRNIPEYPFTVLYP
ncbi:MAG: DUF2752 domain-containing protein, partial [Acidobacteria bacterium]|nr:DUF2752 domain-containing protein [Acidobacteriota bacterium]